MRMTYKQEAIFDDFADIRKMDVREFNRRVFNDLIKRDDGPEDEYTAIIPETPSGGDNIRLALPGGTFEDIKPAVMVISGISRQEVIAA